MRFFIKRKSKGTRNHIFNRASLSVILISLCLSNLTAAADNNDPQPETDKLTARKIFEKLQCQELEILPPPVRLDMLDYWDVDSVYKAMNAMNGLSWLDTVTPTYLKTTITKASTFEIKVLPVKKGEIFMTIYTVGGEATAEDSQIKFYDPECNELPTKTYLQIPEVKDFFEIPKGSVTKMKEIEQMIPFPTIAYSANSENNELKAWLTVEQFVNMDDWNIMKLFIKPYITLSWKKDRYRE